MDEQVKQRVHQLYNLGRRVEVFKNQWRMGDDGFPYVRGSDCTLKLVGQLPPDKIEVLLHRTWDDGRWEYAKLHRESRQRVIDEPQAVQDEIERKVFLKTGVRPVWSREEILQPGMGPNPLPWTPGA
jgi:hypothetical protein